MKIPALEIEQNGKKFYLTYLNGKEIYDYNKIKVDIWRKENPNGYQRKTTLNRVLSFAKFITKTKGTTPLSILLSVRKEVKFYTKEGRYGILEIPDNEILWEVDGQHRIEGLRTAIEQGYTFCYDFIFPVIIMCPLNWDLKKESDPKYLEAYQFFIINRTQKGVRPDLAAQFLAKLYNKENISELVQLPVSVIKDIEWKPKAIEVTEILNRSNSVWSEKIRSPNEEFKGKTLISQLSFTDSLKPILTHQNFKQYDAKELAEFLIRYWNAIKLIMPKSFEVPKEYVIQKITGPFVLHRIFPDVASYCKENRLTVENFKKVLYNLKEGLNDSFWHRDGIAGLAGTNQKAFAILEKKIRDELVMNKEDATPKRPFEF